MNVWHCVYRPESLTYTVAKALSFGGHDVFIWVADRAYGDGGPEGIQRRIRATPRVTIIAGDERSLPPAIDRLIIQTFPRPMDSLRDVTKLAGRAQRVTLITAGDRSRSWHDAMRLQWLELRKLARHANRVDRVLYKDGPYRFDLFGPFKTRAVVGFDVHSQFLHEDAISRAMHARDWTPESRRTIVVNFLGSRDPSARGKILDSVRPLFHLSNEGSPPSTGAKSTYWHEYSDAAPYGLDPSEFVSILSRSDFTLCPRGYSLVTHRPVEALLRGSIPVLSANELDLYGIGLVDGKNCIAAAEGDWPSAMGRIVGITERKLVEMRKNVHAMFETELRYDALSRGIRRRLGIDG